MFNLFTCVQYSHSAWFLDGITSTLVIVEFNLNYLHVIYPVCASFHFNKSNLEDLAAFYYKIFRSLMSNIKQS